MIATCKTSPSLQDSPCGAMRTGLKTPACLKHHCTPFTSGRPAKLTHCCTSICEATGARMQVCASYNLSNLAALSGLHAGEQTTPFWSQSSEGACSSGRSPDDTASLCSRRTLLLAAAAAAATLAAPQMPAQALTLQEVTPQVVTSGPLSARFVDMLQSFQHDNASAYPDILT